MKKIENIIFSHKSMVVDFGRVFFYEDRVFRLINNEKKEYCIELLNSDLFKILIKEKYIPFTRISEEFNSEGSLVLEHNKVVETLQHEWSFLMYKDAALKVFELNELCNKHGYELKDAHTLNVLFDNVTPLYIDFGSISKKSSKKRDWFAYVEYLNSFYLPLLFWSQNKHFIVRKLLESNFYKLYTIPDQLIEETGLLKIVGVNFKKYSYKFRNFKLFQANEKMSVFAFISRSINYLYKIIFKRNSFVLGYNLNTLKDYFSQNELKDNLLKLNSPNLSSQWEGYHNNFYNSIDEVNYSSRFKRLLEIINQYSDIKSIIDLAGNEGYFSILLSNNIKLERIILADYDENAIDKAFNNIKKLKIQNITPILLNFMFTLDQLGTAKRLMSDLVVSLAFTHHLILTGNYSLATIFERLSLFSNKYVMVEFMPLGLWSLDHKIEHELPQYYTLEWFRDEFENYFELILEEKLEENRIVFFGKLKQNVNNEKFN